MHNMPHTDESRKKMSQSHTGQPNMARRRPTIIESGVTKYRCGKCTKFLAIEGFYKNKRTILGITSECRACHNETAISSRDKDNHREKMKLSARAERLRDPEKFREKDRIAATKRSKTIRTNARASLNAAVRSGEIIRPGYCSVCGSPGRIHGHHDDYAKPLNVRWLCTECHGKEHRHD